MSTSDTTNIGSWLKDMDFTWVEWARHKKHVKLKNWHMLWTPVHAKDISVGDIGYIDNDDGKFVRLFNIKSDLDHRNAGVTLPPDFRSFELPEALAMQGPGTYITSNILFTELRDRSRRYASVYHPHRLRASSPADPTAHAPNT